MGINSWTRANVFRTTVGVFEAVWPVKIELERRVQGPGMLMQVTGKKKEILVLNFESVALFVDSTLAKQQNLSSCEERINGNRPLL